MSFLEHLEALRWHIIRAVLAITLMTILAFVFKSIIFDYIILAPKNPEFFTNRILCQIGRYFNTEALCINTTPFNLINIQMSGQLTTHIAVSMVTGVILAFPFVIWEFWRFFKPALHSNEKHYARGAVLATSLLFFTGVMFGYFMIVPLSIHFLGSYQISGQVVNQIYIRSYIGTLTSIVLASGLIFELPIFAFFLTKIGVVTPSFLKQYRRYAIVAIFILAAIITPPDVFSQTLVAIPLLALYEVSIMVSKFVMRKKAKDHDDFMKDKDVPQTENATL
ncbi:MAG: twin-arginine translocase subunit TatC [Odoribacter sp.]|nr:twin-arginine translocase subunit TatC [Odoribacter sp.]